MPPKTTYIDNFLIRRKISGAVDTTDLLSSELILGNTEKSLFVKAPTGSELYQFGRIYDSTNVSVNNTWSSEYIVNYINANVIHAKTILLTAGAMAPTPTNGCESPYVDTDPNIPKIGANFTVGKYGFWNLSIPGDYTGSLNKITVIYSGPPNACQWSVSARVIQDEDNLTSGGTWSTVYNLADTPSSSSTFEITTLEIPINLFGASTNVNNFASVRIGLTSGTGTYRLYQVKIEY